MGNNSFKSDETDVYIETVRKKRKRKSKYDGDSGHGRRNRFHPVDPNSPQGRLNQFMRQEIEPSGFGIIPEGYEGITYFVLFIFLPKLVGMGFFYIFVAEGRLEVYQKVHTGGHLLDWMIGYEILAAIALLIIAKKMLTFVFGRVD